MRKNYHKFSHSLDRPFFHVYETFKLFLQGYIHFVFMAEAWIRIMEEDVPPSRFWMWLDEKYKDFCNDLARYLQY